MLGILLTASFDTSLEASAADQSSRENLVQGNTAFAVQLYRELGQKEGNLFFSPYSVSSALGMTYAGARGNTEKEMAGVLHFNLSQTELHPAFKRLNRELAATARKSGQKLNIANALVLTGGDVSGGFKTILKDSYDAEIFGGGLETINGWVKQKTEGKIEKILEELDVNSVCVLLNAIYFKGTWASPFQKSHTSDAPFTVSAVKRIRVPFMHQKDKFKMLDEDDFQAVDIPYEGKKLSMVILLPRTVDGLAKLEKQLSIQNLKGWLAKLDAGGAQEINLYLPKFKLETGYDLVSPCMKMGMKDAFAMAKLISAAWGGKKDLFTFRKLSIRLWSRSMRKERKRQPPRPWRWPRNQSLLIRSFARIIPSSSSFGTVRAAPFCSWAGWLIPAAGELLNAGPVCPHDRAGQVMLYVIDAVIGML